MREGMFTSGKLLPVLGRFLSDAYMNGMAAWLLVFPSGLRSGPAFVITYILLAAGLKAYAAEPLAGLLGLPARTRPPRAYAKSLLLVASSIATLLVFANLAGINLVSEPISLALATEGLNRLFRGLGRKVFPVRINSGSGADTPPGTGKE